MSPRLGGCALAVPRIRVTLTWEVFTLLSFLSNGCRDRVLLLNKTTEVINFWQDEGTKHTAEEARTKFSDCHFEGS